MYVLMLLCSIYALTSASTLPSINVENNELEEVVNKMRESDENKAEKSDYLVSYQGRTTRLDPRDRAQFKFFKTVRDSLLKKPTYKKFIALLDNYESICGLEEDETDQEKEEIKEFLDEILKTKVWKTLIEFLQKKKHPFAVDKETLRKWLLQLWFETYTRTYGRQDIRDSSGFEHVFVGEIKRRKVLGMHNWIRFYLLEREPREYFNYYGYHKSRNNLLAALKFTWKNKMKKEVGFLLGTSPEFDMALYTLCFLTRRGFDTCNIKIDGCPLRFRSLPVEQDGKVRIGTVFPIAGRRELKCKARLNRRRPCHARLKMRRSQLYKDRHRY